MRQIIMFINIKIRWNDVDRAPAVGYIVFIASVLNQYHSTVDVQDFSKKAPDSWNQPDWDRESDSIFTNDPNMYIINLWVCNFLTV